MSYINFHLQVDVKDSDNIRDILAKLDEAISATGLNTGDFTVDAEYDPDIQEDVKSIMLEICNDDTEKCEKFLKKDNYRKFVARLLDSDYSDIRAYKGRFFYDGIGVVVSSSEMNEVMALTNGIPISIDNMGLDVIIYPK